VFEALQLFFAPYYLYVKTLHLLAMSAWLWSAASAYAFYLVPVFKAWRRNPHDPEVRAMRDWAIERFDQGVTYEHIAFPVVLLTGALLYFTAGWSTASGWLALKLLIVAGIFLPIEVLDYHLSHFGGSKQRVRRRGDPEAYERAVHVHWLFLLLSSPVVMVFGLLIVFLAVTKPL
jgi:uncharacterized membrane protein